METMLRLAKNCLLLWRSARMEIERDEKKSYVPLEAGYGGGRKRRTPLRMPRYIAQEEDETSSEDDEPVPRLVGDSGPRMLACPDSHHRGRVECPIGCQQVSYCSNACQLRYAPEHTDDKICQATQWWAKCDLASFATEQDAMDFWTAHGQYVPHLNRPCVYNLLATNVLRGRFVCIVLLIDLGLRVYDLCAPRGQNMVAALQVVGNSGLLSTVRDTVEQEKRATALHKTLRYLEQHGALMQGSSRRSPQFTKRRTELETFLKSALCLPSVVQQLVVSYDLVCWQSTTCAMVEESEAILSHDSYVSGL